MSVLRLQRIGLLVIAIVSLICPSSVSAADESTLTNEQIKQFLLTAKVIKSKQSGKGITSPWRLTLSDGTVTHDASFQAVDEHKTSSQFSSALERPAMPPRFLVSARNPFRVQLGETPFSFSAFLE